MGNSESTDVTDDAGVDLTIIGDRNATAVAVTVRLPWPDGKLRLMAAGTSKREPGDPAEAPVGMALALARAMRNAAAELEEQAMQRVRDVELAKYAERSRLARKQWAKKTMQKSGLKTAEIRKLYGDEAAELHKTRLAARKSA